MAIPKSTPLLGFHQEAGAQFTTFRDVRVPYFYTSMLEEYAFAREGCALVDLGFYDLLRVSGDGAIDFLNRYCTTALDRARLNDCVQTLFLSEDGGICDMASIIVLETFLLVLLTPGRASAVVDMLADAIPEGIEVEPYNDAYTPIALLGPRSESVLRDAMRGDFEPIGMDRVAVTSIFTARAIIAQCRLFGELCYIVFTGLAHVQTVLDRLTAVGEERLRPIGLGALSMLRLESGEPYPGFEARRGILPVELGLMHMVQFEKLFFNGRQVIFDAAQTADRPWLIGFRMREPIIPRRNAPLLVEGRQVGRVTSGGYSPQFETGVGLGIVERAHAIQGNPITLNLRGEDYEAEILPRPLYKNSLYQTRS